MDPNQDIPSAIDSAAARFVVPILTSILLPSPSSSSIIPQLIASTPALYSSSILTSGSLPSSALAFYSSPQSAGEFLTAPFVVDLHPSAPSSQINSVVSLSHTQQVIYLKLSHNNYFIEGCR